MTKFVSKPIGQVMGVGNITEDLHLTPTAFRQTPTLVAGTVRTVPFGANPLTGEKVRKVPQPI